MTFAGQSVSGVAKPIELMDKREEKRSASLRMTIGNDRGAALHS